MASGPAGDTLSAQDRGNHSTDADRVCDDPQCSTLLSRYNDMDFCALHAPMVVPRMRGKIL